MLVDSSVWVDFLNGESNAETRLLIGALESETSIWLAPPVLQEVLQGADTPQRFARWDRTLGELPMLTDADAGDLAREAARLYAQCRWKGITLRSSNDCLIALYAIRGELPLLQRDRDFAAIKSVDSRLRLVNP